MRALLALLLAGCTAPSASVPCVSHADCAPNERCAEGACQAAPPAGDAGPRDSGGGDGGPGVDGGRGDAGCARDFWVEGGATYCSLEEALLGAPPGSTLHLPPGPVAGPLVLRGALRVVGAGSGSGGTELFAPSSAPAAVEVRAANVELSGLLVSGGQEGVRFEAAGRLEAVRVRGASGPAVRVLAAGIATLEDCVLDGTGGDPARAVLWMEGGSTARLDGVTLEHAAGVGLLSEGGTLQAARTTIQGSADHGAELRDGAEVTLGPGVRVLGSGGYGVRVFDSALSLVDSEVSDNGPAGSTLEDGVWLASPTRASIERNTFRRNRGLGLYCSMNVRVQACGQNVYEGNAAGTENCDDCL